MQNLDTHLLRKRLLAASRIAVLGIGSDLMGDDVAGMLVVKHLNKYSDEGFRIFLGGSAPENITGEIIRFEPTHLIVFDAVDFAKEPGFVNIIEPNDTGGVTFSTHRLPVKIISAYLKGVIGCEVVLIGIQPKRVKFMESVSKEIEEAARELAATVIECVRKINCASLSP